MPRKRHTDAFSESCVKAADIVLPQGEKPIKTFEPTKTRRGNDLLPPRFGKQTATNWFSAIGIQLGSQNFPD